MRTISVIMFLLTSSAPQLTAQEKPRAKQERAVDPQTLTGFTSALLNAIEVIEDYYVRAVPRTDLLRWSIEGLYQSVQEQVPASLAERLRKAPDSKDELAKLVSDARRQLGERIELIDSKDLEVALEGILHHLEPGSPNHIEPGHFVHIQYVYIHRGIGIELQKVSPGDPAQIVTPLKGGPAYRAKVMAGDRIINISFEEDKKTVTFSTKEMSLAEIEKKLQGKPGSTVKLTIQRDGVVGPLIIDVIRENTEPENIFGFQRKSDDSGDFMLDRISKIAYIRIARLSRDTNRDLSRALDDLQKEQIKGLILDLRFCPLGLFQSCLAIADQFIRDGLIMTLQTRSEGTIANRGRKEGRRLDLPMVCLVNGETSGMSEMLAACLQDHRRAIVVGERTSGDTAIQSIYRQGFVSYRCTTVLPYRPSNKNMSRIITSGKETEDWGVIPDLGFAVPLTLTERTALLEHLRRQEFIPRRDRPMPEVAPGFKDRQLAKAQDYLRQELKRGK